MSELRDRVLSFEKELQQNIERAQRLDQEITQLSSSRREYVEGVCQGGYDSEVTTQRAKISECMNAQIS